MSIPVDLGMFGWLEGGRRAEYAAADLRFSMSEQQGKSADKARDYGRRVKEAAERWADTVDQMLRGELHPRAILQMGQTPDLLVELGAPNLPLTMRQVTFKKIAGIQPDPKTGHTHELTVEQVKELYAALADPVAAIQSSKQKMELFVDMIENGNPVLVALDLAVKEGRVQVNSVATGFGHKNIVGKLVGASKAGNLIYLDQKRIDALKDMSADVKPNESVASRVLQARQPYGKKIRLSGDVVKPMFEEGSEVEQQGDIRFSRSEAPAEPTKQPAKEVTSEMDAIAEAAMLSQNYSRKVTDQETRLARTDNLDAEWNQLESLRKRG